MTRIALIATGALLGALLSAFITFQGTLDMETINGPVWADIRGER